MDRILHDKMGLPKLVVMQIGILVLDERHEIIESLMKKDIALLCWYNHANKIPSTLEQFM